ncbi:DUF354 domain-containing protein [Methanolobus bombayensis]|uniref:DUF354 domain-containing protein n=1 Tax=Methanolobus bombayensis TaxID=38023 RepID=UPI001AEAEA8B|nr:DUF354 domain-containing protein [Methanolobus bombayensis]MBP1910289.1 putative glycosyltransferase [Methanolobus bombayensis]
MKVLLDVSHPKDINVFTNVMNLLKERGHEVKLVARAKENTIKIINESGFTAEYGPHYSGMIYKILGIPFIDYWLFKIAKTFKPDIFVSFGSPYSAHVSRIFQKPHIAFIDTEIANFAINLMLPFTDTVYTSDSFTLDLGKKQKKFNSYLELAYLGPSYFSPDNSVLEKYALKEKNYILIRLSALSSHHDMNARGFSFNSEDELKLYVEEIAKYGNVIIFSEKDEWEIVSKHSLVIDSGDFHHILFHSKMCIGEGATMVSEAAMLGVPSIYVSNTRRGYLDDLENKYDLCYTFSNKDEALNKAVSIMSDEDHQIEWQEKRQHMLSEKTDLVRYIVNEIESNW